MPHRHAEFRELCLKCGERSSTECLRCGDPYCEEHAPMEGRRCQDCESDYVAMRFAQDSKTDKRWEIWVGLLGGVLVLPLIYFATKKRRERKREERERERFLAERVSREDRP